MFSIDPIQYRTAEHGDFATEWGPHADVSEWWYATGYLHDEDDRLYSYQYTLAKRRLPGQEFWVLMLALTDIQAGAHHYAQEMSPVADPVLLTDTTAQWGSKAGAVKGPHSMKVFGGDDDWSFDLALDYGKGAYWHCEDGVLRMALPEENETTVYYSYPNMPTTGTITIGRKELKVAGKSWFDKQGGPYSEFRRETHWEWFSLRFDDDEEMMLFSFPQSDYQDGTYIPADGDAQRLNGYTITPTKFVSANDMEFSAAWMLDVPGLKEERYVITPMTDGQLNIAYYEQLCEVRNLAGKRVGLCFVELLPGVMNERPTSAQMRP
ncbi:lipocalin-like domain-containing protein [Demequina sp. NBRC 110054]|uniref:lipocalin-like domain-containing protein n=1 Tax=Demequina sp. NBRC 110054 TaxID=1570343 RepID=UPI000A032DA1|nr:lipocalin-like domain-containing protein [Demequina sp. NBRC 110054]